MLDHAWRYVERSRIYIPGVVVLGRVFEELKLVAASAMGKELISDVAPDRGDATGGFVDGEPEEVPPNVMLSAVCFT